jgi:hypothetical protein
MVEKWYVEVQHGSGPGRSYGYATPFQSNEEEEMCGDQTRTFYGPFESQAQAEAEAETLNQYYNGSDYH